VNATNTKDVPQAEELEQFRRELTGYCYRMLGSAYEAEDAVQNTMLRAWRALPRFDDQAGLRPWLYRIATNVCIDMLNGRSRRALPMDVAAVGTSAGQLTDRRPRSAWIEPAPDSLVLSSDGDPAERAVARESVRLAFIAALHRLAPRQRAVLILRDVLHWRAAEVATLLDSTTDGVNSSLRRARAALEPINRDTTPNEPADDHRALLAAYVDAFERQDVNALVALLREDAIVEMPPFELWLRGAADIGDWLTAHDALRDHLLVPVRANGAPAVAVYVPAPGGEPTAFAIHVLDVDDGRISAIRSFIDPELFVLFGLPLEHAS
jgi:RNA polymerase sigma-70 factor, ECF subfamily